MFSLPFKTFFSIDFWKNSVLCSVLHVYSFAINYRYNFFYKIIFLIYLLAYLSELQSFYIFAFPIVIFSFLRFLPVFYAEKPLDIYFREVWYCCFLLIFGCLENYLSYFKWQSCWVDYYKYQDFLFLDLEYFMSLPLACKIYLRKWSDSLKWVPF